MKTFLPLLLGMFLAVGLFAQSTVLLKEINKDVYEPFAEAYAHRKTDLFASFHSEGMMRIVGHSGQIKGYADYMAGYQKNWADRDQKGELIEFRFEERWCNESQASDIGIYKLTRFLGTENETTFYGRFHVILVKEEGKWKIWIDYDNNPDNTIGEKHFLEAMAQEDYDAFLAQGENQ